VKGRYTELTQASADRCPRHIGTFVKTREVQYHHEAYNQFLWDMFWVLPAAGASLWGTIRRAPVFCALLNFGLRARCDMFSSSLTQSEVFRASKAR
jgi:hypothetical protein